MKSSKLKEVTAGPRYIIKTDVLDNGVIQQKLISEVGKIHQIISMHIMNTREEQIKESLIKLGWTPPPN